MTGLMNRMVQRARGTLSGAEPLVRSHQTAAAALSGALEERIATAAPSSGVDAKHLSSFPSSHASPTRSETTFKAESPAGAIQRVPEAPLNGEDVTDDPRGIQRISSPHKSEDSHLHHGAESTREPEILELRTIKHEVQENIAESIALSAEALQPPQEANRKRNELVLQQAQPQVAPGRQDSAQAGPLDSVTEHTEIHITIGSIELRAPQAEAPRKPAPFKPRVTLDDYLRRRPGAAS